MLSSKQLSDIKKLQLACEKEENIYLKLNWEMLESRNDKEQTDFLHYEKEELIGFLGLYGFGNTMEVCGMVHPQHRRQGVFTKLLDEALGEMKKDKVEEILLNAPASSNSAKAFLKKVPCQLAFSEYQMKWSEIELGEEEPIRIRKSTDADLETEIQLDVECFGISEESARKRHNERVNKENTEGYYVIETEQETVGKIRVQHMDGEAWIYGFAIFPKYQGKGLGRRALKRVIREQHALGYPIFLEVDTKNGNALKLYEACGFKSVLAQDYYRML
ncbi:GNAT family N-acetyltransferase [Bacillus sp. FJAT-49736]|uniref:GNAT family N-acetyltransferase n=1 Tax=Bacillus sp. FJAT-49736 TaxID=2833582 RepID=UPI001BCA241E|nr:GNAT family N-acetyltransferase [Bacillus sp. FJAT-49736]MBS4175118.1 GNAT family N-acetyltransferase [Bacillus sp. FJAT-49736]